MSELMKMVANKRLFKVKGIAINTSRNISHLDEGQLYAAIDEKDAINQAESFWTKEMGFSVFVGHAVLIDRVGNYRIELVEDVKQG